MLNWIKEQSVTRQMVLWGACGVLACLVGCSGIPVGAPGAVNPNMPSPVARKTVEPIQHSPTPALHARSEQDQGLGVPESAVVYPDLWSRMRRGFALPPLEHPLVAKHAERFAAMDYFGKRATRIRQFLPVVVQAIDERKLPMELALVPLVESALNCHAKSVVAATGCWQFMHATATDQRLVVSVLVDQRRDLLKSTTAALDYLTSLYAQTQDWHLALAAYNWGIGRVLKLRDSALAQGQPADFASLAARMPEETRNYVPQMEALKRLIVQADPDDLPEVPDQPLVQTVPLDKDLDVALAARWAGMSVQALLLLNHAVQPPVILAAATPELLLPAEAADRFEAAAQTHKGPWSSWTVVRTQGHAKLNQLASHFGTTIQQLREANGGTPGLKPAAGSVLLVPRTGASPARADASLVASAQRQWVPEVVRITVTPRVKETLPELARRLHVPVASLSHWNPGLATSKPLKKGSKVVLMMAYEAALKWQADARQRPGKAVSSTR